MGVVIVNSINRMQVAFGQDFTKDQYVQSLFGDKGLLYLMAHCLEGVMKEIVNPLAKVI